MIRKSDLDWFWPKISHAKRGGATHTRVMQFKMMWLILDTESYGGTDRIDVASDVYVEVSCVKWTGVTSSYVAPNGLARLKSARFEKKVLSRFISQIFIKKSQNRKKSLGSRIWGLGNYRLPCSPAFLPGSTDTSTFQCLWRWTRWHYVCSIRPFFVVVCYWFTSFICLYIYTHIHIYTTHHSYWSIIWT
jgi:hypothetical protein